MSKVMEVYRKYREPLLYVIVGGMTTVINFVVYLSATRIMDISHFVSNIFAWIFAVAFAFFADKIVVFQSGSLKMSVVLKEATEFVGARLVTGIMDIALFWLLHTFMGLNDILVKIFINIFVIVGNYLFSKFIIFKNVK